MLCNFWLEIVTVFMARAKEQQSSPIRVAVQLLLRVPLASLVVGHLVMVHRWWDTSVVKKREGKGGPKN